MNSLKLNITRKNSFVGCVMPLRIIYAGKELYKLNNGATCTLTVPAVAGYLDITMIGNSMNFHPVKRSVFIDPAKCMTDTVNIILTIKPNWPGVILPIFFPVGILNIDCQYC